MINQIYRVTEIFDSIEGEGKRAGRMAVFIRLAGCNLRCRWCDTAYSLEKNQGKQMTLEEIVERVKKYPWECVTITGGEPMLQPIYDLCNALADIGKEINIETNGAVKLFKVRPRNTFYSMDWKCPGSGMSNMMIQDNLKRLTKDDVLKFVVCSLEDLTIVKIEDWGYRNERENQPQFYISPVFGEIEPKTIVEFMRERSMTRAKIQLQLHKIIWSPDMRGV